MTYSHARAVLMLALGCAAGLVGLTACGDTLPTSATGDGDGDGDGSAPPPPDEFPLPEPGEDPYGDLAPLSEVLDPSYGCFGVRNEQASGTNLRITAHPEGRVTVWDPDGALEAFQIDENGNVDGTWGTLGDLDPSPFSIELTHYVGLDGGRLLVGGSVDAEGQALDGVCLLESQGSPDPTFGGQGGCVPVADTVGSEVRVEALEDGVLVFVGTTSLTKLDWAGVPVVDFGVEGTLADLGLPSGASLSDVVVGPDGSIFGLLEYAEPATTAERVIRIPADGSLVDTEFTAGHAALLGALTPDEDLVIEQVRALAVAADGSVAFAGSFLPESGSGWSWIARLNPDGTPMAEFADGGVSVRQSVTWDIETGPAYIEHLGLAFDGLGQLWGAGAWWLDMPAMARWNASGEVTGEWFQVQDFLSGEDPRWPLQDVAVSGGDVYLMGTSAPGYDPQVYVCRVNLVE